MAQVNIPVGGHTIPYDVPDDVYNQGMGAITQFLDTKRDELIRTASEMSKANTRPTTAGMSHQGAGRTQYAPGESPADRREADLKARSPYETTYNPLTHLSRMFDDAVMGTGQAFGAVSQEDQEKHWEDQELFEAKQPWQTKIAPTAALLAPSFVRSVPGATLTGLGHLSRLATAGRIGKNLVNYGRGVTETAGRMGRLSGVPLVGSAAVGAGTGATMMVDPKLPPEMQTQRRLENTGTGAVLGPTIDAALMTGRYTRDKIAAGLERGRQSGDLPETVPLSSGPLWGDADLTRMERTAASSPDDLTSIPGEVRMRAQSSLRSTDDSIARNAEQIEIDATGIAQPFDHGEAAGLAIPRIRKARDVDKGVMDAAYKAAKDAGYVKLDGSYFTNLQSTIASNLRTGGYDMTDPKIRKVLKRIQDTAFKRVDGEDVPIPVSGTDLQVLQKFISNQLGDLKALASKGKKRSVYGGMSSIMSDYRKFVDESISENRFTGDYEAITKFKEASGIAKGFYKKYYSTPIVSAVSEGKISGNEFSERLLGPSFGVTTIKDTPMRLKSLRDIQDIDPGSGHLLRKELYGYLFNRTRGNTKFGKKDQQDFLNTMRKTETRNRLDPTMDVLLDPTQKRQIQNMENVTGRHHLDITDPQNYPEPTTPIQQFLAKPRLPGTAGVTSFIPGANRVRQYGDYRAALRSGSGRQYKLSNKPMAVYGPLMMYRSNQETAEDPITPWDMGPRFGKWLYNALN